MVEATEHTGDASETSSTEAKSAAVPQTPPAGPVATAVEGTKLAPLVGEVAETHPDDATPGASPSQGLSEAGGDVSQGAGPRSSRPGVRILASLVAFMTTDLDGA